MSCRWGPDTLTGHPSINPSMNQYLSTHPQCSIHLSVHPPSQDVGPSICPYDCPSICPSPSLPVCLSIQPSIVFLNHINQFVCSVFVLWLNHVTVLSLILLNNFPSSASSFLPSQHHYCHQLSVHTLTHFTSAQWRHSSTHTRYHGVF